MNIFQQFKNWFSNQKGLVKLILIFSVLFVIMCCCILMIILIFSPNSETKTPSKDSTIAGSVDISSTNTSMPPSLPTSSPLPTNTFIPTSTRIPTETPNPNIVFPGTYIIGTEIQPGIYKGQAGTDFMDSCYWKRLKDFSGELGSIIANDNSIGQYYLEVESSDYALQTDCQLLRWDPIPPHVGDYPVVLEPGTYLVGYDILPGTYKGQAGTEIMDSCYWKRLSNLKGGLYSILANDNATGQFYVKVNSSDFALEVHCRLERVGD